MSSNIPLQDYREWLESFRKNKRQVASFPQSQLDAVYNVERYIDDQNDIWEIALTYTNRLVMRTGKMDDDDVAITWEKWQTQHNVKIPKKKADVDPTEKI